MNMAIMDGYSLKSESIMLPLRKPVGVSVKLGMRISIWIARIWVYLSKSCVLPWY